MVVGLGSISRGSGFKPSCLQYFSLRFFGLFCVFMFACLHVHYPPRQFATGPPIRGDPFSHSQAHIPLNPPPPRAMGCNRNRPDINTTTVGGRGGAGGLCIPVVIALSRRTRRGGGFGKWTSVTPVGASQFSPQPDRGAVGGRRGLCIALGIGAGSASRPPSFRPCRPAAPGGLSPAEVWGGGGGELGELMHWTGVRCPSRAPSLCPATVSLTPSASLNGICNRQ